jgi:hypothetical protein
MWRAICLRAGGSYRSASTCGATASLAGVRGNRVALARQRDTREIPVRYPGDTERITVAHETSASIVAGTERGYARWSYVIVQTALSPG